MTGPFQRGLRAFGSAAFLLVFSAFLLEVGCQVYAFAVVYPRLDALRDDPRYMFQPSRNPILGYEHRPNLTIETSKQRLHINRWGIRADDDALEAGKRKVAILGDSVVFGIRLSQEQTISALLQEELDPSAERIAVLNFGVPGYALAQLVEQLKAKNEVYDVDEVVYLLNANDFVRRNSVYEGADSGLYRTHNRPFFTSPWLLRKAVYRFAKWGGGDPSNKYKWFFAGNEEFGYGRLREMFRYAESNEIDFSVVLLPSGRSYTSEGYGLAEMYRRIGEFLSANGIAHVDPTEEFGVAPARYFDETDHLYEVGNLLAARLIDRIVRREGAAASRYSPPAPSRR